uniref:Uncharacterized protein n=1 Tax=Oryza brachyantha TaxID=4533 RepID=J3LB82_ORYBR
MWCASRSLAELGYEPDHGVCQASCVALSTLGVWNTLQHFRPKFLCFFSSAFVFSAVQLTPENPFE